MNAEERKEYLESNREFLKKYKLKIEHDQRKLKKLKIGSQERHLLKIRINEKLNFYKKLKKQINNLKLIVRKSDG